MIRKIAVLTQKGTLSKGIQENTTVNIFELDDEVVRSVESVKLEDTSNNYFSMLMGVKKVTLVYAEWVATDLKKVLKTLNINIKCKDEISDDVFMKHFIFD